MGEGRSGGTRRREERARGEERERQAGRITSQRHGGSRQSESPPRAQREQVRILRPRRDDARLGRCSPPDLGIHIIYF